MASLHSCFSPTRNSNSIPHSCFGLLTRNPNSVSRFTATFIVMHINVPCSLKKASARTTSSFTQQKELAN
jgi:hypothetical protein